ncbi:cellulose binding domain-containing protein [Streptomyces sp. NA02950]|uniref:cellulose-binding domain-containing protein n=1 Tax=Streptomyces sp. NA02950 TaxID=2742137 RepID=UPI00159235A4|nr:cellulose-binding domain-containing protein [Streptomyces sp. NA02950]QKV93665.1 cellulose binding domain-containing protein [Streptomyces sp. NA02950]
MSHHSSLRNGANVPLGHAAPPSEGPDAEVSATALLNAYWDAVADYAELCTTSPENGMRLATEAFRRGIRQARNLRTRGWQRLPWLPLLLAAVRKTAADWNANRHGDRLNSDLRLWLGSDQAARYAVPRREQPLALRGLRDLPEADGALLWSVEVESRSVEAVARELGCDALTAAEEIDRVRHAYRERCRRNHVESLTAGECVSYAKLLDAATRSPDAPSPADLWDHLAGCARCREASACLYLHGGGLPGALAGGVLGWGGHPYLERRRLVAAQAPGAQPTRSAATPNAVRPRLWERLLDRFDIPWLRRLRGRVATAGGRAVRGRHRRTRTTVALSAAAVVLLAGLATLVGPDSSEDEDRDSAGPRDPGTALPNGVPPGTAPEDTDRPTTPEPSEDKGNHDNKGDKDRKKPDAPRSPRPSPTEHTPGPGADHRPEDPPKPPACTAGYEVVESWPDGFEAEVTVTSRKALDTWRVSWTLPGSQEVKHLWDGEYTQDGDRVTVTAKSYNARVEAGGTISFGFTADKEGDVRAARGFALGGSPCSA